MNSLFGDLKGEKTPVQTLLVSYQKISEIVPVAAASFATQRQVGVRKQHMYNNPRPVDLQMVGYSNSVKQNIVQICRIKYPFSEIGPMTD